MALDGGVEEEAFLVVFSFLLLSGEHSIATSKVLVVPNLYIVRFLSRGRLASSCPAFIAPSRIAILSLTVKFFFS